MGLVVGTRGFPVFGVHVVELYLHAARGRMHVVELSLHAARGRMHAIVPALSADACSVFVLFLFIATWSPNKMPTSGKVQSV